MKKTKVVLSFDEREALLELFSSSGWEPLMKICDYFTEKFKASVLDCSLETRTDRELALLKARAEGALMAFRTLSEYRTRETTKSKTRDVATRADKPAEQLA